IFKITIYKILLFIILHESRKEIFLMYIITTTLKHFALKSATCIINCMKLLLEKGFNFRIFC
ncbi:hypothetical protein COC57_12675, partial [Bacillus thuringiensis]